jgi:prepilin-type N-terminal cleavage/methylation domain-containing protein
MKKNGFTLVELMVVVIVIGVLAAVSMPKFQIAADKAKVAEVQQILPTIAGAQEQYKHANDGYLELPKSSNYDFANRPKDNIYTEWKKVGLDVPESKYFNYEVTEVSEGTINDLNPLEDTKPKFTAKATLLRKLTYAEKESTVTIDEKGCKDVSNKDLNNLIPTFGAYNCKDKN